MMPFYVKHTYHQIAFLVHLQSVGIKDWHTFLSKSVLCTYQQISSDVSYIKTHLSHTLFVSLNQVAAIFFAFFYNAEIT